MKTVHVNLGARSYDILIGRHLLERLPEFLSRYERGSRIFVVSNPVVFELYGAGLKDSLQKAGFEPTEFLIPDGEQHKTLTTVENIYTYLIAQGADRSSLLMALGGGVTGDVAGFVAATFLRGIPLIQIPTTLLAQVDSSVGGKTGVNHHLGKNLIGAFYQPDFVSVDLETLSSLPERQFNSGLYEVIKYGLIYDAQFFDFLEKRLDLLQGREPEVLETVISRCCEIKAEVISNDEREEDLRRILNFGHTFGHALEAAFEYQGVTHGEAVGYGMLAALRLSRDLGYLDTVDLNRVSRCIRAIGRLPNAAGVPFQELLEAMQRDKKRHHDDLVMILLKGIGQTVFHSNIDEHLLAEAWSHVLLGS